MTDINIKFAFAVNHSDVFEAKHFGDADKYLMYEYADDDLKFVSEQINTVKTLDEEPHHGSGKKGNAIINLLKENEVKVLVSRQFGKNIKMVNQHFIPVIISSDTVENTLAVLIKHIKWIIDELKNKSTGYKLFTIRKGILKTIINNG